MKTNLERYKKDLERLVKYGDQLLNAMCADFAPEEFRNQLKEKFHDGNEISEHLKNLPSFINGYQQWYSEALILLKQLLPDRVSDFVRLYEKPKNRKNVTYENYMIEDALVYLTLANGLGNIIVEPLSAIHKFQQQLNIVKSINSRFESSLFDIKQLVQADLFDSELDAARELNKKGFMRGAGAVAGVVLESHLSQVCENHKLKVTNKNPTINDFNQLLKDNDVIDIATWSFIRHLADLRNLCDHDKKREPKKEEIEELIDGVDKITKTIY